MPRHPASPCHRTTDREATWRSHPPTQDLPVTTGESQGRQTAQPGHGLGCCPTRPVSSQRTLALEPRSGTLRPWWGHPSSVADVLQHHEPFVQGGCGERCLSAMWREQVALRPLLHRLGTDQRAMASWSHGCCPMATCHPTSSARPRAYPGEPSAPVRVSSSAPRLPWATRCR